MLSIYLQWHVPQYLVTAHNINNILSSPLKLYCNRTVWQQVSRRPKRFACVTLNIRVKANTVTCISSCSTFWEIIAVKNITWTFTPNRNKYLRHNEFVQSVNETFPGVRLARLSARETFLCCSQLSVFPTTAGITSTTRATASPTFKQQRKHLQNIQTTITYHWLTL